MIALSALAVASLLCAAADAGTPPGPLIAVSAARMLDVRTGALVPEAVVLVRAGRIEAAGTRLAVPPSAERLELGDVTLLPGLIDTHAHLLHLERLGADVSDTVDALKRPESRALLGAAHARSLLEAGFTTVRDVGNSGRGGDAALRDAISAGWVAGPRIIASTRALAPVGGQSERGVSAVLQALVPQEYLEVTGPAEARRAVRQAILDGADCIKVIVEGGTAASLGADELAAIVTEAHGAGLKVAAHAIATPAATRAVLAGVDSIEHGYALDDGVLKLMAAKQVFLVPTDWTMDDYARMRVAGLPEDADARAGIFNHLHVLAHDRLRRALRLKVPIAFGSDNYVFAGEERGPSTARVARAYAAAGMSPSAVVRSATLDAARLLGLERDLGSVEPGKRADLAACTGPLDGCLEHVRWVMKGGEIAFGARPASAAGGVR